MAVPLNTPLAPAQRTTAARAFHADRELATQYETIKSEALRRLGSLYNASDYPTTLDGLFDLDVSYPTIEPPNYLMSREHHFDDVVHGSGGGGTATSGADAGQGSL